MNQNLQKFIEETRRQSGQDLAPYDEVFLGKCLDRRLAVLGLTEMEAYAGKLAAEPTEMIRFFDALQVSYSEFFRNPLIFALLEQVVLPMLVAAKEKSGRHQELRIWSAGCAAGQEPYSVAMLLQELVELRGMSISYRIFATDRSETALAVAAHGMYAAADVQNIGLRRLERYFSRIGDAYALSPSIKERVTFAPYDLLDRESFSPPGSIYGDFDLILCCNLLFYYRSEIRQAILGKFRRALLPGGWLATGETERELVHRTDGFRALLPPVSVFRADETAVVGDIRIETKTNLDWRGEA